MTCPCCGAKGVTRLSFLEGLQVQIVKVAGLVVFFSTAVLGQSDLVGEPWRHVVTVAAFLASTLLAWNIKQHPVKEQP